MRPSGDQGRRSAFPRTLPAAHPGPGADSLGVSAHDMGSGSGRTFRLGHQPRQVATE